MLMTTDSIFLSNPSLQILTASIIFWETALLSMTTPFLMPIFSTSAWLTTSRSFSWGFFKTTNALIEWVPMSKPEIKWPLIIKLLYA